MLEPILNNAADGPARISTVVYYNTAQLIGAPGLVVNPGAPFITGALNLKGSTFIYVVADTAAAGAFQLDCTLATVDPSTETVWDAALTGLGMIPNGVTPGFRWWIYAAVMTADITATWANALRLTALIGAVTVNRLSLWGWGAAPKDVAATDGG